ncbi:hypothetical protein CRUP_023788, partial [Coryphaenoides rupestris]
MWPRAPTVPDPVEPPCAQPRPARRPHPATPGQGRSGTTTSKTESVGFVVSVGVQLCAPVDHWLRAIFWTCAPQS